MIYFLFKTEPNTYSIDDLEKDIKTIWDGVHNFQAISNIKKIKVGDMIYIYHSRADKAIVGIARAISLPRENKADPRKSCILDIEFVKKAKQKITLAEFKREKDMQSFALVKNNRLSVMEIPELVNEWIKKKME